jgi:hypothetical protein
LEQGCQLADADFDTSFFPFRSLAVYAYIPMTAEQCAVGPPYTECNDMYGTSVSPKSIFFTIGRKPDARG